MPNKYDLETSGSQSSGHHELRERIVAQFEKKQALFEQRAGQLENITQVMNVLLPIGEEVINLYSAKSVAEVDDYYFASALLHQAWNFTQGVKLFPDVIEYKPEITLPPGKRTVVGRNASEIENYARRKGGYAEMVNESTSDLIRGETISYREYETNEKGDNVRLRWVQIPWQNYRQPYKDTDEIVLFEYSLDKYVEIYNKAMLRKVMSGGILGDFDSNEGINFDTLTTKEKLGIKIQVIRYIDAPKRLYAEVHGGGGYIHKYLIGKNYPWIDSDGTPFSPIKRQIMYEPFVGHHGWGILDILLPVAKLETTIVNASANRAVLAADPLTIIASNKPEDARRLWNQHRRNRRNGDTTPFFVGETNTGTKITPQNVDIGTNDANFQNWQEYLLSQATMRTGIDFRVLTEFAPTAEQQRLRKLEQDKINVTVLHRNKQTNIKMAQEDIYMLQNTTSEFHNIVIHLETHEDEYAHLSSEAIDELRDKDGRLPTRKETIGRFLKELGETEFDITPRLEGIIDDKTFLEMEQKRADLALLPPETPAYKKVAKDYFSDAHPRIKLQEADFEVSMPPPQEAVPV